MQPHYRSSAILIACLMVPFGAAIYEDAKAEDSDRYGAYADEFDYGQGLGDDYYDDYAANSDVLPNYAEYARAQDDYGDYDDYGELLKEYDNLDAYQEPRSMSVSFFDATFFAGGTAKAPTLSGPFAGIAFGQTRAHVGTLHPDAGDWPVALADYPDATADFQFAGDRLASIAVSFPDDGSALRSLTAQWGAPSTASGQYLWHDDTSKLQAQLVSSSYDPYGSIILRPYQELTDFIGRRSPLFGFEDKDLLSLSPGEIDSMRTSSDYEDQITLHRPHFANSSAPVAVILTIADDRVSAVTVNLDIGTELSKTLYTLLEGKLGRPTEKGGDEWGQFYTFKKGARAVTLNTDGHGWNSIHITRK